MEGFYAVDDYLNLPRPDTPWLIQDLVPLQGSTLVYGPPKIGKSFLALQVASAVGDETRNDLLGFHVAKHGRVMYLQVDTPRPDWSARVEKMIRVGYAMPNVYFADRLSGIPQPFNMLLPSTRDWLRKQVDAVKPLLVVVDVFKNVYHGNENDTSVIQPTLENLVVATQPAGLMLVHHARKEPNTGGVPYVKSIIEDIRGSSYLPGAVDMIIRCSKGEISWVGRSVEQHDLEAKQYKELEGAWDLDADSRKQEMIITDVCMGEGSDREKAKELQARLKSEMKKDLSEEGCRTLVRRKTGKIGGR